MILSLVVLANGAGPAEMQLYAAVHLGLYCLQKYLFRGFQSSIQRATVSIDFHRIRLFFLLIFDPPNAYSQCIYLLNVLLPLDS